MSSLFLPFSYKVVMKSGSLGKSVIDLQKEIVSSHSQYKSYFYVLSGNDLQNFHFPPAGKILLPFLLLLLLSTSSTAIDI